MRGRKSRAISGRFEAISCTKIDENRGNWPKFIDGFFGYLLVTNELSTIFAFQVRKNQPLGAERAVLAQLERQLACLATGLNEASTRGVCLVVPPSPYFAGKEFVFSGLYLPKGLATQ